MSRLALLWCGLVIGVSFIATPAKFQAESLTLPVALDVGRSTFALSHLVQLVLAAAASISVLRGGSPWLFAPVGALLVQHLVLLPLLDARVAAVIAGAPATSPSPHILYVGLEVLKIVVLGWVGARGPR